jgi:hypothetical protein
MLNSPRGKDIYGHSIDWQTAKIRMLDHYQSDQITHQQELAALPYVFDKKTCEIMMGYEREVVDNARMGNSIVISVMRSIFKLFATRLRKGVETRSK